MLSTWPLFNCAASRSLRRASAVSSADSAGNFVLFAETSADNRASQAVLERNGFQRAGERLDRDDGVVLRWQRAAR